MPLNVRTLIEPGRYIGTVYCLALVEAHAFVLHTRFARCHQFQCQRVELVFGFQYSLGQIIGCIIGQYRNGGLRDDRTCIHFRAYKMHRATADFYPRFDRPLMCMEAFEYGQQGGVDVELPVAPVFNETLGQKPQPDPRREKAKREPVLKGDLPSPLNPPAGCAFRTRCPFAEKICEESAPRLEHFGGNLVACHRAEVI